MTTLRASSPVQRALEAARAVWGQDWQPSFRTRAPGRLELLGNHVDYNGGPVLAAAIDRDTVCLVRDSGTSGTAFVLADVAPVPARLDPRSLRDWRNTSGSPQPLDYVRGVIATALDHGRSVNEGIQISVSGDVPVGLGLSSSASFCVALTLALHDPVPDRRGLVLSAQEAEHRAGTPCGTMDQAASVGGNVILYDGATAGWTEIAPELGEYVFAVADSGVSRSLGTSSYPRRVDESKLALTAVNRLLGTRAASLAAIDLPSLTKIEQASEDVIPQTLKRRVRHVITEVARVREGLEAMHRADWLRFGALMSESGRSSAIDYEISHPRVEELVAIAETVPGVAGARMMGGGEGGIALVLLPRHAVPALVTTLSEQYYARFQISKPDPAKVFRFAAGAVRNQ
jgi:galactokinase